MDFSGAYIRARKEAEDRTPLSPEAIAAIEATNPYTSGAKIPETSTLTGKYTDRPEATIPSHGPPEPRPPSLVSATGDLAVKSPRVPDTIKAPPPGTVKSVVRGAAHGTIGLAEAAGTGAEIAGELTGFEGLAEAGKVTRDFWSNMAKAYEPHAEISGAVMDDPSLLVEPAWWAYTVADTLPSFAASIIPGAGAGKAIMVGGKALKLTPALVSKLAKIGGSLVGGASGGALEGSQTYKAVLERGGSKDQAIRAAAMMTAASGGLNALSLGKMQTRLAGKSRFVDALISAGTEGVTEWLEEPSEWFIERAVDDGTPGYTPPTVPELKEKMRQGVNVFFPSAVLGGGGAALSMAKVPESGDVPRGTLPGTAYQKGAPVDDAALKAEADRLGIVYRGMQPDFKGGQFPMFNDERPGSTGSGFVVMPGETVEGGLNRVRTRFGLSPLLTPEKILNAFPGAAVAADGADFTVSLPNGVNITILSDQSIVLNPATGVTLEPGETLAGEYTKKIGPEAIIRLAKEGMGDDTLLHESFHAAMDFALTPQEKAAVLAEHGGDVEAAAQAYATWNPEAQGHPFFAKIRAFFQKMREMLLGPTAEGTFGRLRSGEAWTRGAEGGTEGTSYQTKPASNAPAFFSKLLQTIDEKMPNAASASDVRALLRSQGVKADEIRWSGIEHLLSGKEKLTKDEVRSWVEANTINVFDVTPTPKFEQYTLPGQKKGYGELLLTLSEEAFEGPATKALSAFQVQMAQKYTGNRYGAGWAAMLNPEEKATYKDLQQKFGGGLVASLPKIGHFSETPGTIAHIRFDERRTAAGGRMLFIEEIQSDWHQQGRDKGYKSDVLPEGYGIAKTDDGKTWAVHEEGSSIPIGGLQKTQAAAMRAALKIINEGRVPEAPFKSSWPELALKRMLRYAAENGDESLGWTTGAQQADRYNLAKYIDKLTYVQSPDGTYTLVGDKNAGQVFLQKEVPQDKIADYVGKEIASKIIESGKPSGDFTGLDLQVGGQGMNYFYDKMIPSFVEKYGKKWGAKVETEQFGRVTTFNIYSLNDKTGLFAPVSEKPFSSKEEAEAGVEKLKKYGKDAVTRKGISLHIVPDTGSGYQIHWADEDMGQPGGEMLAHEHTFPTFEAAQKQAVEMAKDVAEGSDPNAPTTWRDYFQDLVIKPAEGEGKPTGYKIVGDAADSFENNNFPTPEAARTAIIDYLRDPWYEDPEMFDREGTILPGRSRYNPDTKEYFTDPNEEIALAGYVDSHYTFDPIYGGQQVHSLKITPQMKEDVLGKGQPLYQIRRQADSPPFVSQLRNVVADEKMFPPSMKSVSVVNTLMKYGVKAAEIQDTGLAKFLSDKARVTREQVLDYIDMNMVRVEEKVRTDDAMDQVEELDFSEPEPDEETGEYPEDPEWFAQGMSSSYSITPWKNGKFNLEVEDRNGLTTTPISSATGTVAELIRHANEMEREDARSVGNVKFEGEVLPGAAKNYRELLITLPEKPPGVYRENYQSSHWDEPNVLAHIRFDERVDAEGKRTLFIEEVQSDWHIAGRRGGYKGVAPDPQILRDAYSKAAAAIRSNDNLGHDTIREAFDGIQLTPNWRTAWSWDSQADIDAVQGWLDARQASYKETGAVPDAPFKDTWWEMTMKRAIRWAAEHGFDSISWTTGEQQQDRYDLSKRIDSLEIKKATNDTGYVVVGNKGGMGVVGKTYPREELPGIIGKDLAGKALAELDSLESKPGGDEYRGVKYSGLDLKIGGRWAVRLYDEMIPGWLNKYAKKWGVKVGETDVVTMAGTEGDYRGPEYSVEGLIRKMELSGGPEWTSTDQRQYRSVRNAMEGGFEFVPAMNNYGTISLARRLGGDMTFTDQKETVHSLQIPPQMAADVLKKGQPLYQKKSGRFPGEPNDKGYTFNSNDAEEVKNAGRAVLLGVWPQVEFTQSNEETAKRAQAMLDEGIVNIERLLARDQNQAFETPELSVAADRLRHGLNARLVDTAKQWLQGGGEVSDAEMDKAIALAAGLTQVVQGGISQTGRVQQSRQMAFEGYQPGTKQWTDAVSGTLESLRQLQGAQGMSRESIVRKILAVPEPTTFIPKLVKITSKDMFIEAWYGALLSNPVTHAANFIGNTVALFSSIPERGLASLAHRITGKGEGVAPGEAFAALYGAVAGFQDALRFAAKTAWTGESSFQGERMERRTREPAITGANLGVSGTIGAAVDLLGMAIRGPGRALLSSDEFFKAVNFRMEVYAQAYREAYSEGLTGDDLKNRMAEMVENPPEQIQETAAEWANYQTFTNALGPLGSAIVALSNAHPALKVVLPFVATPTNILKYTFERMGPLSLALKSVREDISSGGSRRDLAIARISLGSMVMGTAAYLAAAGFITGGGPKDKDLLAAKRRQGWQPYSFLVGDKYYSFSRLEPYATLFGMTADIVEMAGQRSDLEIDALAKAMVLSFAKNMTNKTYLTGVSDALDAITDPDKSGGRFVHRFVGSWVPAGVAQLARSTDPVKRSTYGPTSRSEPNPLIRELKSMIREAQSRTPGWRKDLIVDRNLWGDKIELGGGYGWSMISPIYTSTAIASPVDDEILRNKVSISMPPRFLYGSRPSEDIPMKDESTRAGIPLTPKEYDFLVRVAAGQKVVVDGEEYQVSEQTLKADLEQMIETPEYKAATDGPDGGKALMIRAKVTAYRDAAKAMLLDASPELAGLYEEKINSRAEALIGVGQ